PNGAGKSTTMRMITQYFEPDGGSIRFDGTPLAEAGTAAKRRIGFLPENNPLYGDMLVAEYLDFVARLRDLDGADRRRSIDEAVTATAIEAVYNRPINELSKGFRQRVGIRQLISHLGRERTVILSTHVLGEVQYTCSRLLIINRGKIVADDSVD